MSGYYFLANLLWLDFVNTEPVQDGARVELLTSFADVVGWLREAGALDEGGARRALARWERRAAGETVLEEARALRGALRAGAERLAGGRRPGRGMLDAVNRILASRPAYARLVAQGDRFVTRLEPVRSSPLQLLVPVAESVAWLLEHGDPALVRRCSGDDCVLFFYDTTKNHSRRWCSMDACGGRAKAGAYYRRQHPPVAG
jgi:predicted RNA-binding Zn ribbon-like protein